MPWAEVGPGAALVAGLLVVLSAVVGVLHPPPSKLTLKAAVPVTLLQCHVEIPKQAQALEAEQPG